MLIAPGPIARSCFALIALVVGPCPAADLSQDLDVWVPNGQVRAIHHDQAAGITYIGGNFSFLSRFTGPLAALDALTGQADSAWSEASGSFWQRGTAMTPDGAGGWFIGGSFTRLGGYTRVNLAHLHADGSVDADWRADLAGSYSEPPVSRLLLSGGVLYVAGAFHAVSGVPRMHLAALDAATGALLPWNPSANAPVSGMGIDGATIYVGGYFTAIGASSRGHLAAIGANGVATSWNPAPVIPTVNSQPQVSALLVLGHTVYVAGSFTAVGGSTRPGLAAINASGSATAWNPGLAGGRVLALASDGALIHAGGYFSSIGGASRAGLAAIDLAGVATSWNPGADGVVWSLACAGGLVYAGGEFDTIGGATRHCLASIDAAGDATAWDPGVNDQVRAIGVNGGTVVVGGMFDGVARMARSHLAALDADGIPTSWNPGVDGDVGAIAKSGTTIYVAGGFGTLAGEPRINLGAVDTAGAAQPWNPGVTGQVNTMTTSGGALYVGGEFSNIAATARSNLAAFDAAGALTGWNPQVDGYVRTVLAADGMIYAGGRFSTVAGQPRSGLVALDATTGVATAWPAEATGGALQHQGEVVALAEAGGTLYVGGYFTQLAGEARHHLGAVDTGTGVATAWDPQGSGGDSFLALAVMDDVIYASGDSSPIGGRFSRGAVDLDAAGTALNWDAERGYVMQAVGGAVYIGGDFTEGSARPYYAVWRTSGNALPSFATPGPMAVSMDEDGDPTPFAAAIAVSDADGDTVFWEIDPLHRPHHGVATIADTGALADLTYVPSANYHGSDSFVVRAYDLQGGIASLTIEVTILPRNDPPVATEAPAISGTMGIGATVSTSLGTWDDWNDGPSWTLTHAIRWQLADDADGTGAADIAGVTTSTYVVAETDRGKFLRSVVTATDTGVGLPATASADAPSAWRRAGPRPDPDKGGGCGSGSSLAVLVILLGLGVSRSRRRS